MKYTTATLKKNWLLQKIPWTDYWIVKEEFIWFVNYETKLSYIIIPKWFRTNFWSIPKLLQIIFSPTKYLAYVLHDYLYSKKARIILSDKIDSFDKEINSLHVSFENWDKTEIYTIPNRKFADKTLREAIKVEWWIFLERFFIYLWVRMFWFLKFNK